MKGCPLTSSAEKHSKSIATIIMSDETVSAPLSEEQHKQALDYLSIQLSIRDREQITRVLCHSQPDHLTESVRDVVAAYEPIIRYVHNAVDLSDTVGDFERFVRDMLQIGRIRQKDEKAKPQDEVISPTVGDFVQLLKKHQGSCHKFLHQCAKNGKEVTSWFHDWARDAAAHFRQSDDASLQEMQASSNAKVAGSLASDLETIFSSLQSEKQAACINILDTHSKYLKKLHYASGVRLASVVNSPVSDNPMLKHKSYTHLFQSLSRPTSRPPSGPASRSSSPSREDVSAGPEEPDSGPGAYLAKWQALLDDTAITPATAEGPVRYGRSKDVQQNSKIDADSEKRGELLKKSSKDSVDEIRSRAEGEQGLNENEKVDRPDVQPVVDALLPAFRELLGKRACNW